MNSAVESPVVRLVWPRAGAELDLAPLQALWTDDLAAPLPSLRHLLRSPTPPLPELLHALDGPRDAAALARRTADPNADPALLAILAGAFPAAFCANPALPLLENPAFPATFDPAAPTAGACSPARRRASRCSG